MIDRRTFLLGGGTALVGGCTMAQTPPPQTGGTGQVPPVYQAIYGPRPDERFPIPAVDLARVDAIYWRREVANPTGERPGMVVVDTGSFYLYWTMGGGRAMRYGVGLGREGFGWDGTATIERKQAWPTWTPPAEMIAREPELEQYRNGMDPGLGNPLGARALYLYQDGRDTLYRLHGTQEAHSIGRAVSSGCVRLLNQDVIDLYERVPDGTRVVVRPPSNPLLG
ncbi:L,D-transpeptidase [Acuticoccus sediminis]|uniref:L,D-transpeptidase n=1 Tax=Acuticoccus sediminis TaxID=2184697 RepID=A0A8B2NJX6_9HYPH|nr:L,D-transpeptidase [Acuticoccus sediminis]RAH96216.1 L,D-transpeptidase [Acuticoccus sediminis]